MESEQKLAGLKVGDTVFRLSDSFDIDKIQLVRETKERFVGSDGHSYRKATGQLVGIFPGAWNIHPLTPELEMDYREASAKAALSDIAEVIDRQWRALIPNEDDVIAAYDTWRALCAMRDEYKQELERKE